MIVAIVGAADGGQRHGVNSPVAISAITAGLGILSVVLILFRIISPPDFGVGDFGDIAGVDVGRKIGVFLGLIAAGGIAYGGWTAMQEEGTSFADRRLRAAARRHRPPPVDAPAGRAALPSRGAPPPDAGRSGRPDSRAAARVAGRNAAGPAS